MLCPSCKTNNLYFIGEFPLYPSRYDCNECGMEFKYDSDLVSKINSPVMVVMRGLPGSGKSYLAKKIKDKLQEFYGRCGYASADNYWGKLIDHHSERTNP